MRQRKLQYDDHIFSSSTKTSPSIESLQSGSRKFAGIWLSYSRIDLNSSERFEVINMLGEFLKDKSRIVKTFSMQALADIAAKSPEFRDAILHQLEELKRTGSPAMKSRGRRLLAKLKAP
jgi:hypothetical protein